MKRSLRTTFLLFITGFVILSCKSYKYHYMFKIEDEKDMAYLTSEITAVEKNYVIQPNDYLDLRVYTNKGEFIIDPNYELQNNLNQSRRTEEKPVFLVQEDSTITFPMIGTVKITGMTLREAEAYLSKKYNEYYKDAFVKLKYLNKRVIVLGAPGGQVIPLENEEMSVLEVIALAGGIDEEGKAFNVRLIRGDLHDPQVFLIDLSTIDGMVKSQTEVQPGDIVYIEPNRKIVTEGARDFMTVFSILISSVTLVALIIGLTK